MNILDIERHIRVWGKNEIEKTKEEGEVDFGNPKNKFLIILDKVKTVATNQTDQEDIETVLRSGNKVPTRIGLTSKHKNSTDLPQEHVFQIERETVATVSTTLQEGYSCPGIGDVVLGVPNEVRRHETATQLCPVVKMFESEEASVTHEKINYTVKSKVTVPPDETYEVKVNLKEVSKTFITKADVRFTGTVVVQYVNEETRTLIRVATVKIDQLFKDILKSQQSPNSPYSNLPRIPIIVRKERVFWPIQSRIVFNYRIGEDTEISKVHE